MEFLTQYYQLERMKSLSFVIISINGENLEKNKNKIIINFKNFQFNLV